MLCEEIDEDILDMGVDSKSDLAVEIKNSYFYWGIQTNVESKKKSKVADDGEENIVTF